MYGKLSEITWWFPCCLSQNIRMVRPTVQPLRVVQPDAVCEDGGSTPDRSHGDLGTFLGGGPTEKSVH